MKTTKPYRIVACLLAILMFSTSMGFAIDMHYCGDQLKSFNLFGKAKTCIEKAGPEKTKACRLHHHTRSEGHLSAGYHLEKSKCCHSKTVQVQSDQNQEVRSVELKLHQPLQQFIISFVFAFLIRPEVSQDISVAEAYRPPLIPRDIPVLTQSFLL